MKTTRLIKTAAAAVALTLLASCGEEKSADNNNNNDKKGDSSAFPASLIADAPIADAKSVVAARADGKPGEAIVLRGKVGGKKTPLSDKAAIFVLADEKEITSCDDIPGDSCPTPWDYCCEDPDKIKASIATIQIVDADGKVIREGVRGLAGIKELSRLIISGTVDESSTPENMIVNATSIHVEKP